jgi:hypothetical protein
VKVTITIGTNTINIDLGYGEQVVIADRISGGVDVDHYGGPQPNDNTVINSWTFGDELDPHCFQCGALMLVNEDGTTNHLNNDGEIDHDADADHVPYAE